MPPNRRLAPYPQVEQTDPADHTRKDFTSDQEVRIRSDRSVPYRFVEPVMIACARAGAWNVTFAVIRKEGE